MLIVIYTNEPVTVKLNGLTNVFFHSNWLMSVFKSGNVSDHYHQDAL